MATTDAKKARVLRQQGIRSYMIQTADGNTYRRNRRHLNWIPKTNHFNNENISEESDILDPPPTEPAVAIFSENSSNQHPLPYQTRSGRNVRPPLRYGQT